MQGKRRGSCLEKKENGGWVGDGRVVWKWVKTKGEGGGN
jgi:hypothetical protein